MVPGTAEHSPESRLGVSQQWLQQLGFTDNPFALRQAGLEKRLEEYFVEPPGYELARGPHSVFLFAPRGGGKTACRIMIERTCRPHESQSEVLAVPYYAALETLATEVGPDWSQTGRDRHIEALLRQTLYALYEDIVSHDEVSVYTDQVALLRGLIDRYAPDVLAPQNVISRLRQAAALRGDLPDLDRVLEGFEKRQLRQALGERLVSESKSGRILVSLVDSRALPATELPFDALARVARTFGIRSVFVLVDGLEEYTPPSWDARDRVRLLSPLLSHTGTIEHPFVKFKFFLPISMLPVLRGWTETEVHMNRYLSQTVAWPDAALHELLRLRLMTFSGGRVESLKALFDEPGSVQDPDARLVRWASGSPRALLELGDDLLDVPHRSPERSPTLTEADLEAIEKRFQDQYAPKLIPPLRLERESGRVLAGDQLVAEMSGMELALLLFLYDHAGEIKSKEDIWERVYEYTSEGVSNAAIDSLVYRVRKKIERDSSNPVYLKTVPKNGYQLLNTIPVQPERHSP